MIMKLYIGYFYQKTITVNSWSIDTQKSYFRTHQKYYYKKGFSAHLCQMNIPVSHNWHFHARILKNL